MKNVNQPSRNTFGTIMSYAGWGIGLASLMLAMYSEFIKKDEPRLEYDIVSNTKFINNSETSANLRILVDSLDVQENHLNISAFNIKIENKGTANIRYDDYDKGVFGLKIQNGTLLEVPMLIESTTEHLKSLFPKNDSLGNNKFVSIPNLSLDRDDNYVIRVVVLHNEKSVPTFIPEGKIVGQREILLNTLQPSAPGFWEDVFRGNWLVHIVRFFLYLIFIAVVTLIVGFTVSYVSDKMSKRKRRKLISGVKDKINLKESVVKDYVDNGEYTILQMRDVFKKNENEVSTKYKKSKGFVKSKRAHEKNNHDALRYHKNRYQRIRRMIECGYFDVLDDDTLTFNKQAKESVEAIYSMLESKGIIRKGENGVFLRDNSEVIIPDGVLRYYDVSDL